jgi:rubrerythrin
MAKPGDKPTDLGLNRTGIGTAPLQSKKMIESVKRLQPTVQGDPDDLEALHIEMSRRAPPVGLMPPPPTLKGVAKAAIAAIKGEAPLVFLDKLGERLAYERTGVRLYQALMVKWEASSVKHERPERRDLERLCDDELRHFGMLERAIEKLGADPTVVTPCADVMAVGSSGCLQVLTDPRTTFTQALSTMLTIELTDNDSWRLLIQLARGLEHDDLASEFQGALVDEDEHLVLVRRWLSESLFAQAGIEAPPVEAPPPPP